MGDGSKKIKGCWDSIHVFEAVEKSSGRNANYKLTSTVMLWLEVRGVLFLFPLSCWSPSLALSSSHILSHLSNFFPCCIQQTNKEGSGMMKLGGSLTRQSEKDFTLDDNNPHIANIGHMVEEMENSMRSTLDQIYFGKTKDIVNDLR